MSNIPVSKVERTAAHPAWTPVSVDGTAVSGATVGDPQAFGIGTADKDVGGNTFKGDSGQMITISGYNFAENQSRITRVTGIRARADEGRMGFEVPGYAGSCRLHRSCLGGTWMAKLLHTIFRGERCR